MTYYRGTRQSFRSPPKPLPAEEPRGLVVHAAWLGREPISGCHFALWAEARTSTGMRRARLAHDAEPSATPRSHGFCAKPMDLHELIPRLWRLSRPGVTPRTYAQVARLALWLPSLATRAWASPEMVAAGWAVDPTPPGGGDVELSLIHI